MSTAFGSGSHPTRSTLLHQSSRRGKFSTAYAGWSGTIACPRPLGRANGDLQRILDLGCGRWYPATATAVAQATLDAGQSGDSECRTYCRKHRSVGANYFTR